jgi:hypothetical protein
MSPFSYLATPVNLAGPIVPQGGLTRYRSHNRLSNEGAVSHEMALLNNFMEKASDAESYPGRIILEESPDDFPRSSISPLRKH